MAKDKSKIVAASGTAVSGARNQGPTSQMIQDTMSQAGLQAMAEGITDPDEVRNRKLEALKALKDRFR